MAQFVRNLQRDKDAGTRQTQAQLQLQRPGQRSTLLLTRHDLLDVRELADGGHLRDGALERAHLLLPLGHLVLECVEPVAHNLELVELVAGHLTREKHRCRVAIGE